MISCQKRKLDSAEESDSASVNSRTVGIPLPAFIDECFPLFGRDEESLKGGDDPGLLDGYDSPLFEASSCSAPSAPLEEELTSENLKNLKAMIEDSCLSTKPVFKFKMPWERKGLEKIFKKDSSSLIPVPVMTPIEVSLRTIDQTRTAPLPSDRTKRGAYSEVINFDSALTEKEVEDAAMVRALEKWYVVFSSGNEAWPSGFDLHAAVASHSLDDMRTIFGCRSHNTILRRGSSVVQFIKWYRCRYFHLCPFPLSSALIEAYLEHLQKESKSSSCIRGFVEAINFCHYVVGMDIGMPISEVSSAKVKRIIDLSDSARGDKVQARVLTVKEVEHLEYLLSDERVDLLDRVACGCMLFCLYSRSRWSDIRRVYNHINDISETDGRICGYVEFQTRTHKTSRLVAKSGIPMPLVAPVWGLTSPPWGLSFVKVCKFADRPLKSIHYEPLLVAPKHDGNWSDRSVTTKEAGKWLRKLLGSMEGGSQFTTIHTLKSTPLSWIAKWGLDPEVRAVLGHHSTKRSSVECYGRDNLAKPLRDFESVLQQIRTKSFSPDATRSGMLGRPMTADPSETFVAEPPGADLNDDLNDDAKSSTSSEGSTSSSSSSHDEDLQDSVATP